MAERSNLAHFSLGGNFLKNCLITMTRLTFWRLDEWLLWAMFEPTPTWPDFTFDQLFIWIGQIMTRYDFLEARWVILFDLTPTWPDYTFSYHFISIGAFSQLCISIGASNDKIWFPGIWMSDFEQCSNRLHLNLISLLVNFLWPESQ